MHPILGDRRALRLYLMAWLPIVALLAALLRLAGWPDWPRALAFAVPLLAADAFLCLAAWYPCRALPLAEGVPRALIAHLVTAALVGFAITAGGAALARLPVLELKNRAGAGLTPSQAGLLAAVGMLLYLLSVAVHYLLAAVASAREAEKRALEAEVTARQAQLETLKAQVNPHFLFNSLNSIAALAGSEPATARSVCVELAGFLRGTLGVGGRGWHPVSEELELARRYLHVEQARLGERLRVEEEIDAAVGGDSMPPLLLLPLVENAIKHGVAQRLDGGTVRLIAKRRGDALVLGVDSPLADDGPAKGGPGVGLANIRRRLRAELGDGASLSTAAKDGVYRARIVLGPRDRHSDRWEEQ